MIETSLDSADRFCARSRFLAYRDLEVKFVTLATSIVVLIRHKAGSLERAHIQRGCGRVRRARRSLVRKAARGVHAVRAGFAPHARATPKHVARHRAHSTRQRRPWYIALASI